MKIRRFPLQMAHAYHKINTFCGEGTQRRTLVSPWRMHCMYSDMANDTSWAEVTSSSEKVKPVTLAIVELCESEGIRQAVS